MSNREFKVEIDQTHTVDAYHEYFDESGLSINYTQEHLIIRFMGQLAFQTKREYVAGVLVTKVAADRVSVNVELLYLIPPFFSDGGQGGSHPGTNLQQEKG